MLDSYDLVPKPDVRPVNSRDAKHFGPINVSLNYFWAMLVHIFSDFGEIQCLKKREFKIERFTKYKWPSSWLWLFLNHATLLGLSEKTTGSFLPGVNVVQMRSLV